MAKHDEKPERDDLPDAEILKVVTQMGGPYAERALALLDEIKDKVVGRTAAGRSGYCLVFTDGSWVVCYLAEKHLDWRTGSGPLTEADSELMSNSKAGDTRGPLTINCPYANEVCDIEVEVARATGQSISGVAVGDDTFNICFPDGHELDASIVPDPSGVLGLRVFWEQW